MSDCSTNAMKPKDNTMAFLSALDRRFPPKCVAHLEGTEWSTAVPHGFPDSVVFANDGSVLDGTYETRRYVPEQRFEQLERVAREMLGEIRVMAGSTAYTNDLDYQHKVEWVEDCVSPYRRKLEALGVSVDD